MSDLDLRVRFPVDDQVLSSLHTRAFGGSAEAPAGPVDWAERLARHSVTWVGAFHAGELIGFVHACWDGGSHAFLLDTAVDPQHQRQGIGRALVQVLVEQVARAGCEWLHVDYRPELASFYEDGCEFAVTRAGLIHLGVSSTSSSP